MKDSTSRLPDSVDVYDAPEHPIPALGVIDVLAVNKQSGGANLVIVIASPLRSDEMSQKRLLDKIEGYLRFIASSEFTAEAGVPTPENTKIKVSIHPDSDIEIFTLLERCRPWVLENGATLVVERKDEKISNTGKELKLTASRAAWIESKARMILNIRRSYYRADQEYRLLRPEDLPEGMREKLEEGGQRLSEGRRQVHW